VHKKLKDISKHSDHEKIRELLFFKDLRAEAPFKNLAYLSRRVLHT